MTEDKSENYKERRREQKVDGERLDRRPGHGAGTYNDEIIDRDATESEADGPRTTFHERDGDGDGILKSDGTRVSYEQLWYTHMDIDPQTTEDDIYNEKQRMERRRGLVRVFTSALECTSVQTERALTWVDTDMTNSGSINEESLVAAAISIACRLDDRWVGREDTYRELLSKLNIDHASVEQARQYCKENNEIPT
jgi:hypothetical protein